MKYKKLCEKQKNRIKKKIFSSNNKLAGNKKRSQVAIT